MRLLLAALLFAVAWTPLRAEDDGGAEAAWRGAWVAFPAGFAGIASPILKTSMAEAIEHGARERGSWPTVVYVHGCKGHGYSSRVALNVLGGAGFVVIAPDSFARKNRPETCDPKRKRGIKGAPQRRVTAMRFEEIAYAAQAAPRLPWVDRRNLVLYGHSQGGGALSPLTAATASKQWPRLGADVRQASARLLESQGFI